MSTQDAIAVALDLLRTAQDDAPEELLRLLTHLSMARNGECPECYDPYALNVADPAPHTRACRLAHWLRIFGGEEERQRQVDAAHKSSLWPAPIDYGPIQTAIARQDMLDAQRYWLRIFGGEEEQRPRSRVPSNVREKNGQRFRRGGRG